jgi:hypothetical protein
LTTTAPWYPTAWGRATAAPSSHTWPRYGPARCCGCDWRHASGGGEPQGGAGGWGGITTAGLCGPFPCELRRPTAESSSWKL